MHRCLEISEVLCAIFDQTNVPTLASLARTCHTLREPALDAHIWQELVEDKRQVLRILNPITPEDWNRVRIYNYRVKELAIETAELDADFFRTLACAAPDSFLFPNLRILSWTVEDDGFFPFCRPFLPPTLNSITLILQDSASDLSMLSTLRVSHPNLTEVHLHVPESPVSVSVISNALCAWNCLTKLTVATLDANALVHIASLPQLTHLELNRYVPPISAERLCALMPAQAFPALQHLDIGSDSLQSAFALIAHVSSPRLRALHINNRQAAPAAAWEASLRLLTRLPSLRPSRHRRRQIYPQPARPPPPAASPPPFYRAPTTPLGIDLDDAALEEMSGAWPRLERLALRAPPPPRTPRTTLRAVAHLAEHCPHLCSVQMALDTSAPPRVSRLRTTRSAHALVQLNPGDSPVGDPARVAAFLSGVFAQRISFGKRTEGDPWAEVARLFRVFRGVRIEEARFWKGERSDEDEDEGRNEDWRRSSGSENSYDDDGSSDDE
ncbi:hypothetical protein FB451DRAFT_1441522 [Mycena latifolia]|nr:hypothetical protein FB451DRAFT_1441522 [Mycena latifolia]